MKLLEHFKVLTIHPKNANKLKGLILQLAIQGKLTKKWREENRNVEPASVLLEKIKAEKEQLIKDKKIKKEKPLPKLDKESRILELPNTWVLCRLGEIGDWGAGATPSRSRPDFYGGNINWFKSGELNNGVIDFESSEKINEIALKNSSLRLNKAGDVLIAMYGATIGKTAMLAVEGATNQAVCGCTPFSPMDGIYLHLLLKGLKDVFINQGEGGAQPNISRVKIRTQVFSLPPLEEQKAIVEVVNQLFKEVEQLEKQTKARIQLKTDFVTSALQQLATGNTVKEWSFLHTHFKTFFTEKSAVKKLRETVLQLAVQGKLTQKWRTKNPAVESASLLLEKIKDEKEQLIFERAFQKPRQSGKINKGEFNMPSPQTWEIAKIVDLCFVTKLAGFEYTKHINLQDSGEIPVIRAQNVKMNRLDERKLKYIDQKTSEILYRCALTKPCLLMTFIGAGIGDVAIFDKEDRWHLAPNVAKLEPFNAQGEKISPKYLLFYLMSPVGQKEIFKASKATAQPSLSMGTIRDAIITIPPYREQQAIVQKVNALLALCDQLEQGIEESTKQVEQLMQSCLKEVFEG